MHGENLKLTDTLFRKILSYVFVDKVRGKKKLWSEWWQVFLEVSQLINKS